MLLCCLFLCLLQHARGKTYLESKCSQSLSKKEILSKFGVFIRCVLSAYQQIPVSLPSIIQLLLHFTLFGVASHYLQFSFALRFLFLEFSTVFYPSYLQSSFFKHDAVKYSMAYFIDATFLIVAISFEEIVFCTQIASASLHLAIFVGSLVNAIHHRCSWKTYDFNDTAYSLTDLGVIDNQHMILIQHQDSLEILAIEGNQKNAISIASTNVSSLLVVQQYYPNQQLLVTTQKTSYNCSPNSTSAYSDLNVECSTAEVVPYNQNIVVSVLQIPSLQEIYSSARCLAKNQLSILNDQLPLLAVFDTDSNLNTTKIRIFNLLQFNQQSDRFVMTQAFSINEYFAKEDIKLFMSIKNFSNNNISEIGEDTSNHVIITQKSVIWDIDTSHKKATELLENAPPLEAIHKINERVLALCGYWRIVLFDMPSKVKIRRIDCFHAGTSIIPIYYQQENYIVMPNRNFNSKNKANIIKNSTQRDFQSVDGLSINPNEMFQASFWQDNNSISVVVGNKIYIKKKGKVFSEKHNEAQDFSICVTE